MSEDHGQQNASGWASSIAELVAALECDYNRLEELRDERDSALYDMKNAESGEERTVMRAKLVAWDEDNGAELAELTAAATLEGDLQADADSVQERIQEAPLSVQVRSGWHDPGEQSEPEEFEILLSTGGPALHIRGELDQYKQPRRAWLEHQDWGTPWTEYHGEECSSDSLLAFCQQFYFGE